VEQQAIVAGSEDETYLGVTASQRRAIVELVDGTGSSDALCSGTFVTPEWVATAAHCLAIPALAARVQAGKGASSMTVPVASTERHDQRDLALLHVDFTSGDGGTLGNDDALRDVRDLGVTPIPVSPAEPALSPGNTVELAGFGLDENGASNRLTFVVESVVELTATQIAVDGFGTSGACEGDSGGPLLVRSNGALSVRGVLTSGAASCRDVDHYLRLDDVADWIESVTGVYAAPEQECGTITDEGRCLYGAAVYCAAGTLRSETCRPGTRCGWDGTRQGFHCVPPASDPCAGVDRVGVCRSNVALRCDPAGLRRSACAPCGTCRVDSQTGTPFCSLSAP
jgi:secreted trypsin-like serine protease